MPTSNRRAFLPFAIRQFAAQDYSNKELVIVDDGTEPLSDLIPADSRIRYLRLNPGLSLGTKRNRACSAAQGDIILHWDDDDWYAPWRITQQVEKLRLENLDMCGVDSALFVRPKHQDAWEFRYCGPLAWVCGATLCYRRALWSRHPFEDLALAEDTTFVQTARGVRIATKAKERFFLGRIHEGNTAPKELAGVFWHHSTLDVPRQMLGAAWDEFMTIN